MKLASRKEIPMELTRSEKLLNELREFAARSADRSSLSADDVASLARIETAGAEYVKDLGERAFPLLGDSGKAAAVNYVLREFLNANRASKQIAGLSERFIRPAIEDQSVRSALVALAEEIYAAVAEAERELDQKIQLEAAQLRAEEDALEMTLNRCSPFLRTLIEIFATFAVEQELVAQGKARDKFTGEAHDIQTVMQLGMAVNRRLQNEGCDVRISSVTVPKIYQRLRSRRAAAA